MNNLLNKTLEQLSSQPIAHAAILASQDVDGVDPNVLFLFFDVQQGGLKGAVLMFRLSMELFPHKIDCLPVSSLGDFAQQINEDIKMLLGSFTATSNLRDFIVNLRNSLFGIESDARDGVALARATRKLFEENASFRDVFFPSEELEQLAQT